MLLVDFTDLDQVDYNEMIYEKIEPMFISNIPFLSNIDRDESRFFEILDMFIQKNIK